MESKQITLRSQTVQCQNCGEYYSVTYKYCPFCEFGKPEERKPSPKSGGGGLLGGLLGGQDGKKTGEKGRKKSAEPKKRRGSEMPRKSRAAEPQRQEEPVFEREETVRAQKSVSEPRKASAPTKKPAAEAKKPVAEPKKRSARPSKEGAAEFDRKTAMGGYADWYSSPEYEAIRRRSGPRKKTSEMNDRERAIYQAEREARAAERKRERERMTRVAAMNELNRSRTALVPEEARPQEIPSAPVEPPVQEPVPVPVSQPVQEEPPVQEAPQPVVPEELDPESLENVPLFIPEDLPEIVPETVEAEPAPVPSETEGGQTVPAAEPYYAVPTAEPEQPSAAEPEAGTPERDLDDLLREIREMLGEPVPAESPEPAAYAPVQEVVPQEEIETVALPTVQDVLAGSAEPVMDTPVQEEAGAFSAPAESETETGELPIVQSVLAERAEIAETVPGADAEPVSLESEPAVNTESAETAQEEQTEPSAVPQEPFAQEKPLTAGELLAVPEVEELTIDQIMNEVKQGLLDMPAGNPVGEYMSQQAEGASEEVQPSGEETYEESQPVYGEAADQPEENPQDWEEQSPSEEAVQEEPEPDLLTNQEREGAENPFLTLDDRTGETPLGLTDVLDGAEPEAYAGSAWIAAETEKKPAKKKNKQKPEKKPERKAEKKPEPKSKSVKNKKDGKKKSGGGKKKLPILPIVSLLIIAVAIVIVVHSVVPAFRTGILSGGGEAETQTDVIADTAETFTLDQTELNFVEPGAKVTLTPVFEPEGSTAHLDWSCDNWTAVFLDPDGTVTSMAPGDAVVTATMANGQSVQCQIHCNWEEGTVSQEAEASAAVTRTGGAALVSNDITLSQEGASKTIELAGAESAKWESSNPSVATVDQSGVVTAVSKGSASITAEVDGKILTCAVRCVW